MSRAPGITEFRSLRATHVATIKHALAADPGNVALRQQLEEASKPIDWMARRQEIAGLLHATLAAMDAPSADISELQQLTATRDALEKRLREVDRWQLGTDSSLSSTK